MQFITENGPLEITVQTLIIAGWTGRNMDAVRHHIDELAAIGVPPPSQVPLFYRVSRDQLTFDTSIEVLGNGASGEVEPMLIRQNGRTWLGLASDHTDRDLETTSVAASKQICPKPCSQNLWGFEDVKDHLDEIKIQSWIWDKDDWILYQDGTLRQLLPLSDLSAKASLQNNTAMLCGTVPTRGRVRAAKHFKAKMFDPKLDKTLELNYDQSYLPIIA